MALVRYPEDNNPDHGGGPIRRGDASTVYSGEGMPPRGYPTKVYRAQGAVVYDMEPGGARVAELDHMMFLPDGRLVKQSAMHGAEGRLGYEHKLALARVAAYGGLGDPNAQASSVDPVRSAPGAKPGEEKAEDVLKRLSALFAVLSNQAREMRKAYGERVPCSMRARHKNAVDAYGAAMGSVLKQIADKGGAPVQTYQKADGSMGQVAGTVPILPPTFPSCTEKEAGLGAAIPVIGWGILALAVAITGVGITSIFVFSDSKEERQAKIDADANAKHLACYEKYKNSPDLYYTCGKENVAPSLRGSPIDWTSVLTWTAISAVAAGALYLYFSKRSSGGTYPGI